jgi:hypothetical protein
MPYDPLAVWEWEGGAVVPDEEAPLEGVAGFDRSERGDRDDDEPGDTPSAGGGRPARGAIGRRRHPAPRAE